MQDWAPHPIFFHSLPSCLHLDVIDQLDFSGPAVDGDARAVVVVVNQHRDRVKFLLDKKAVARVAFAIIRWGDEA